MHSVVDKNESQLIVGLVRKYLAPYQPEDYELVVNPDSVRRDDEWYYVEVGPDRKDVKSFDYNPRLAKAEEDIEENEHCRIQFIPVMPD